MKKSEYPQIPDLDDLSDHRTIEPLDNTGLLILSTPNSYHKGQCSIGRRRFCYWGYNYMDNKNCWISGPSWDKPLKFKEAVQLQNAKLKSSNAINKNNFAKDSSANEYDELMINHSSSDEQIISELEEQVAILNKQIRWYILIYSCRFNQCLIIVNASQYCLSASF